MQFVKEQQWQCGFVVSDNQETNVVVQLLLLSIFISHLLNFSHASRSPTLDVGMCSP